jgi:hypothetical protein
VRVSGGKADRGPGHRASAHYRPQNERGVTTHGLRARHPVAQARTEHLTP